MTGPSPMHWSATSSGGSELPSILNLDTDVKCPVSLALIVNGRVNNC